MEAATAGKALISTQDSGGVLGLAKHDQTGWVVQPEPQALAAAMMQAYGRLAAELGHAARAVWTSMGITWPKTIARLLSCSWPCLPLRLSDRRLAVWRSSSFHRC